MNATKIRFIEKEPFSNQNVLWAAPKYFPCYMLKDGIEYFLWNRTEPSDRFAVGDCESRKKQLLENGGAFFKFYDHSGHNSPISFLNWVKENNYSLVKDSTAQVLSDGRTFDFHGNLNEVSCAFFYRIFDKQIIEQVSSLIRNLPPVNPRRKRKT